MPSIFEISADIEALDNIMARLEVEDVEEVCSLAARDLDAFLTHIGPKSEIETLLAEKVDGYVSFYRNLEATAKAIREEEKHLAGLRRVQENRMKRLKDAVKFVAERLGRPKLEGKTRSITVSTSTRPGIHIADEEAVPMRFKQEVPAHFKILKAEIADYIKVTDEIPPGVQTRKVVSVKFK